MNTPYKENERHQLVTLRSMPEHRNQVKKLLMQLAVPVRSESGCLYYHIYEQSKDTGVFFIAAGWENEMAEAAHTNHPDVPDMVKKIMQLLSAPIELVYPVKWSESPFTQ